MKEIFRKIVFSISILVFLWTSFQLFIIYRDYKKINDTFDYVVQEVMKQETDIYDNPYLQIDWNKLFEINEDVIGWIYFEGTNINYPIMHYEDNDYYLYKDINRDYSIGGSVFADARNIEPFIDNNTVLHAHNMKNDSMFGTIPDYVTSADFRDGYEYIHIYLPDGTVSIYRVFSANKISSVSDLYQPNQEDRQTYISNAKKNNVLEDTYVDLNMPTIMLSTCVSTTYDQNSRYAIHAVLEESGINAENP